MVGGRLAPSFSIGMALWGAPLALLGALPRARAALILFGFIGVGNILIDVAGLTMLQRAAPEDVLARVFGVLETAILTSVAARQPAHSGARSTLIGTDATFVVVGLFLPVLAALSWPRLSAIDADASPPDRRARRALRPLPLFSPLGPRVLESLARRREPVTVAAGESVFDQGDPGDRFYVIVAGEAQVLVDGARARVEGPGEHFGEIALLQGSAADGDRARPHRLDLLCLEASDFVAAVSGDPPSRGEADAVSPPASPTCGRRSGLCDIHSGAGRASPHGAKIEMLWRTGAEVTEPLPAWSLADPGRAATGPLPRAGRPRSPASGPGAGSTARACASASSTPGSRPATPRSARSPPRTRSRSTRRAPPTSAPTRPATSAGTAPPARASSARSPPTAS